MSEDRRRRRPRQFVTSLSASWPWVVVVGFDLLHRLLRLSLGVPPLVKDRLGYWVLAQEMSSGDWALMASGATFRPPAYPWFLALLQIVGGARALLLMSVLQHVAGVATNVVIAWIVWRLTRSRVAALAAYAIAALGFARVAFASAAMPETTFMLCVTLAVGAAMWIVAEGCGSPRVAGVVGGLLIGIATLERTVAQYFPALFLLPVATALVLPGLCGARRRRMQALLPCVVGFALVLSPWLARNLLLHGELTLTFSSGRAFWLSAVDRRGADLDVPELVSTGDGDLLRELTALGGAAKDVWPVYNGLVSRGMTERAADHLLKDAALDAIARQPGAFARSLARQSAIFWYSTGQRTVLTDGFESHSAPVDGQLNWYWPRGAAAYRWLVQTLYVGSPLATLVFSGLAWLGVAVLITARRTREVGLILAASLGYFWILTCIGGRPLYRYRMILEPLMIVAMTAGGAVAWDIRNRLRSAPVLPTPAS